MTDQQGIRAGKYSYRFRGFSMQLKRPHPWHIVGLGTLDLKNGVASNGLHESSIHRHGSRNSEFTYSTFSVDGTYKWVKKQRVWIASLAFVQLSRSNGDKCQTMDGTFSLVENGTQDSYWLISTGAEITIDGKTELASEVVEGEVIRISD